MTDLISINLTIIKQSGETLKMMNVNKRTLKYNRMAKQAGMTLIELTVVLLILVGLAGLLVPYVGSFTQKTHDSTNSSNLSSLNAAFGRYVSEKNKLPDNLESLTDSQVVPATAVGGCATHTGEAVGAVYCGLLDPTMFTTTTYTGGIAGTPSNIAITSLTKAGITSIHDNDPAAANKTFNSGTDGVNGLTTTLSPTDTTTTLNLISVAGLSANTVTALKAKGISNAASTVESHLALALGGHENDYDTTCYDYIALGIGDHNKMIGNTIQSAPVNFPEDATFGPVDYYNHYLAIIQVDKDNTTQLGQSGKPCSSTTEKAKFLGVVANVPAAADSILYGANQGLALGYENGSNQ